MESSAYLIQCIKSGDKDAFRVLYGQYSRDVYHTALEELEDETRAGEVVRQVFLRLLDEILTCKDPDAFDADAIVEQFTTEEITLRRMLSEEAAPVAPKQENAADPAEKAAEEETATRELLERARQRYDTGEEESGPEEAAASGGGIHPVWVVLIVLFFLLLLWAIAGLLMTLRILPACDLGYSWFDSHIYPFFLFH